MMRRLLVLAPHADDEVIGAGGLIARTLRAGRRVTIGLARAEHDRLAEAALAAEALGGAEVVDLGLNDQWLTDVPRDQLVARIEDLIEETLADTVLLPDEGAAHQEHQVLAQAAMAALRPSGATGVHRPVVVACYEQIADVWRQRPGLQPTWYVRLSPDDLDRKVAAMGAHRSQARAWPSERSTDALVHLARLRGAQAGVDAAEAFTVLRWLS